MKDKQNIKGIKFGFCCSEECLSRKFNDRINQRPLKIWNQFLLALLLLSTIACSSSKKGISENKETNLSKLIIVSNGINPDSLNTTLVKGIIVDEQATPLIGANIKIDNINKGIIADLDGDFEVQFSNEKLKVKTLSVQYVGYEDFVFKLEEVKNKAIKIVMFQNATIGGELVAGRQTFWQRLGASIRRLFR